MDGYEFVVALTEVSRWPLVIIIAMVALRIQLGQIVSAIAGHIPFLQEAKVANVLAKFDRAGVEKVIRDNPKLDSRVSTYKHDLQEAVEGRRKPPMGDSYGLSVAGGTHDEMGRMIALAKLEPRAAIIVAFVELEATLRDVSAMHSKALSGRSPGLRPIREIVRELVKGGIVEGGVDEAVAVLSTERNRAAHVRDYKITLDDAVEYAATCLGLRDYLLSL